MKRTILFLLLLLSSIESFAVDFSALAPSGQTLYYNIVNGNAQVTFQLLGQPHYSTYPTGALVIPSTVTYNGTTYSVTSIGADAFYSCSGLTSVTIPNSVTSIGDGAFAHCSGLTGVTIPNSVTYIGNSVFYDCSGLTSVTIPNSVTSIGNYVFYNCSVLTSVTIPNSVTSIGDWTFYNCDNLTSVTIPNSVTSIGDGAFQSCNGLTSLSIGNSVTSIGDYAFVGCSSGLTSIVVETGNTHYDSRNNCNAIIETGTNTLICGCRNTTIPNSVTSIGVGAFRDCSGLTSVTIPNSVTSIGDYAFSLISGLTSVTIPNSVTSIGSSAFSLCSGLTSVNYTGTIDEWCGIDFANGAANPIVYSGNLSINDQLVTDAVIAIATEIKPYAFDGCSDLTSVTIGNSVTSIGVSAFGGCIGLTSVTVPNSVTSIGDYAFYGCSGLTSVTIGNSVTSIGEGAFYGCSNVDTLYYNARNLTTTSEWGGSSSSYNSYGFRPMTLNHLVIGDSVQTLPAGVFCKQYSLTSVTIPNSVTSIGDGAFYYCSGLTSVTIPNSVTSIGDGAFRDCSGLTSVTIPNSVTSIGDYAFYYCSGLTSVTIPNSVTSIGDGAFLDCSGLTSVTIPNSVTSIGWYAFQDCSGLTSVTIGNSVTNIGGYAFDNCSSLTSVTLEGVTPPTLGSNVFRNNAPNRKIYVHCGAYDNYYNANNEWSNYRYDLSDPIVDIDVTVNTDTERGSVSVIPLRGQNIRCDSTVVVNATANYGYHFDHWSTGSTQTQDTIAIEGDTMITAYFAKNRYAINVVSSNMDMGNVFGADTIDYLDSITISAVANYGYHFTRWGDNDTHSVRTFQVTYSRTYTAHFAFNQYQLTVVPSNTAQGTCSGSGAYNYLSNRTISATANYGYHFTHWSTGSTQAQETITIEGDTTITAYFAANQTNGIDEVDQLPTISVSGNSITVVDAQNKMLSIFDITGRMIVREQAVDGKQYTMPHSGVYMVQVGNHPAEKVVVIR